MTTPEPTPYGTPESPRVAVRGEARLEADPELARISVTVEARGGDRKAALDDLARRNSAVLDLVTSYGEAVHKLETGSFVITPELAQKGRGERVKAYHGRVHITATLTDFTVLGDVVTRLADLDLTTVSGPWWSLRPGSTVHRDVRQRAVRAAVRRAREYAEALDARLVALVELADEGAESTAPTPRGPGRPGGPAPQGLAGAAPGPVLDLQPQRQTVYARVNARFIMSPPQL
ncbi:SIMPL domain-containing protein [Streptomyces sp. NPDC002055]|uniref:SIMPL domain-containing protein n=1 Tax=Streptomyces sp. NPDC002055 TaxID=3154534 RepID=UPI003323DC2F